jgi:hypothetical protein
LVKDQLAAQIGLLLVAFHEELLGAAIEFPVDMADGFACVVKAMLGKLHRKAMEGTLM